MYWLVLVFNEYELLFALAAQWVAWVYRLVIDVVVKRQEE